MLLCIKNKSYNKTKQQLVAFRGHPNGTWVDNPQFLSTVSSSSQPTTEEDDMFPEWMRNKKDMIYNMTCITFGKELGQGQFGTVFQAKIQLSNAV